MNKKDLVSILIKEEVAYIAIERQEKLNALNKAVLETLNTTFLELDQRNDVHVIVITGAGEDAFAAGADLGEILNLNTKEEMHEYYSRFEDLYKTIWIIKKPVIAKVNGMALGGGCLLALACDFVVAHKSAKFSQPEINFGFIGGSSFLSRVVGKQIASEITMLGKTFTADEAYRLGLVNRVLEREEIDFEIGKICKTLKTKSPYALSMIKECVKESYNSSLTDSIKYETEAAASCLMTNDSRKAIADFVESKK
ncbi:MAG: enoyl-CoA hydratase/isomerase family protein [Anaerovoracaceae bacterium]|jgi:enoyl-CoA hydratase|nr:enoyl-CoA hydratase/isomerase family protein [Anaerovoracaceae bacterium]